MQNTQKKSLIPAVKVWSTHSCMKNEKALISIRKLSIPRRDAAALTVPAISILPGSCTVIYGPNGSGKSYLSRVIAGEIDPSAGSGEASASVVEVTGEVKRRTALVSFDAAAALLREERRHDESDISGGAPDLGRSIEEYLGGVRGDSGPDREALLRRFRLDTIPRSGIAGPLLRGAPQEHDRQGTPRRSSDTGTR